MDALVNMTVWNHIGKKYMIEKLHIGTRKLDAPTKRGIFCLRRDGARTGSGAMKNSTMRKRMANMHARVMDMMTAGFDHWIGVSTDLTYYAAEDYLPEDFRCNARSKTPKSHQPLNQLRLNVDKNEKYIKIHR